MEQIVEIPPHWRDVVLVALAEDLGGAGDITSDAVVPADARLAADFVYRQAGVVCGLGLAQCVFEALGSDVQVVWTHADGDNVASGTVVGSVQGAAREILAGERTALNFVSRLSGVATRTRAFVDAVGGTQAQIYDSRKTTPLLRELEKYAVRAGGGFNHRLGLFDMVLIKDNHLAIAGGVQAAVRAAREAYQGRYSIEVEVESLADAIAAADAGADIVMLDNAGTAHMRQAVEAIGDQVILEASGGVTLRTAPAVAATGVHRIAIGGLTNGAGIDVALDVRADEPSGRLQADDSHPGATDGEKDPTAGDGS